MRGTTVKRLKKKFISTIGDNYKLLTSRAWRRYKKLYLMGIVKLLILLALCTPALAEKIYICTYDNPQAIQERFAQFGYKVDLGVGERTDNSFGYLDYDGEYILYTYYAIPSEDYEHFFEEMKVILLGD